MRTDVPVCLTEKEQGHGGAEVMDLATFCHLRNVKWHQ